MTLTKKIKGAMLFKNASIKDVAAALGIKPMALSNKFYRNAFTLQDLIVISNYLGFEVCMFDGEQKIIVDKADLEKPCKKEKE